MRILYIATARMPTEKAHGIQIMKMCEAFAGLGAIVELLVPFRRNDIRVDTFTYYGVARTFSITTLPVPDLIMFGRLGFFLHRLLFGFQVRRYAARRQFDILYSRDEVPLFCLGSVPGIRVLEAHEGRWTSIVRVVSRRADKIVMITRGLRDFFVARGVPAQKLFIAPDGVAYEAFSSPSVPSTVRASLGISLHDALAIYTGHLYAWKGADTLANSALFMPDVRPSEERGSTERSSANVHIVFVGGTESDCERFRKEHSGKKNVHILGHKPYGEIPGFLAAADVLVIPNSAREDISRLYTSPMKLFEYMAAGRPIVASDLPSIREVLDEKTASFFKPDDPSDLARVIKETLRNVPEAKARAARAKERAKEFDWHTRARNILAFIGA